MIEVAPDTDEGFIVMNSGLILVLALILVVYLAVSMVNNRKKEKTKEASLKAFNGKKASMTHVSGLFATALADGKLEKNEIALLVGIAKREGLSDSDIQSLLEGKLRADFTIPEDDETKKRYLKDLVTMMMIDGNIAEEEITLCCKMAVCYGYSPDIIKEIVNELLNKPSTKKTTEETDKNVIKEEGRYYFYDDRCSFKLSKDDIKQDDVEKDGMKHTLMTESIGMVVIEIRPSMPDFGNHSMLTEELEVAGYPCLGAYLKTPFGLLTHFYINCNDFVVQIDLPNQNTAKEMDLLNSFRKEGSVPEKNNSNRVDYVKELEKIIYEYCESAFNSKPTFHIHENINFKRNLNFDGFDMAEISMAFEKKYPVRIPEDHPFNHRLADDTDFTVGYFLSAYGLIDYELPKGADQENGVKYVWILGFYDWDWNKPNPWGNPTYGFKPNPNSRIEKDKKPEVGDSFESKGESLYVEKCEFHQKLADGTEEYYVVPTDKKP